MTIQKLSLALAATTALVAAPARWAQQAELALSHWVGAAHPLQVTGMEP